MSEEIIKTFRNFNTIKIKAASDKDHGMKSSTSIHNHNKEKMKSTKKLRKIIILKKK